MKKRLVEIYRFLLPRSFRLWIVRHTRYPRVGKVNFGDLRRTKPISRDWGGDRGLPVDRYYIEKFLNSREKDIRGQVLEVGDNVYTKKFGGQRVKQSDVLHAEPGNPKATLIADLANAPHLPGDIFDCVICTQTLHLIPDLPAAIRTLYRILSPRGVLLATVPGFSQIYKDENNRWDDFWRFTSLSAKWFCDEVFGNSQVSVQVYGNVLAATAFLQGLAAEELNQEELDFVDPQYELLITIRAKKSERLS